MVQKWRYGIERVGQEDGDVHAHDEKGLLQSQKRIEFRNPFGLNKPIDRYPIVEGLNWNLESGFRGNFLQPSGNFLFCFVAVVSHI